ncbi:hypothetical protein C4566_02690 [Candidatus Parcubacteria bacterium]|nr:MAG: hypothetical protein C4566_02690 [Candidatus Parcubacteria bacterium]
MLLKEYQKFLLSLGLKKTTIKNYTWNIEQFLLWLDKNNITEENLKKYFDYLIKKYPRVATINLRLTILNNYLQFLGKRFRYDLLSDTDKNLLILNPEQLQNFLEQASKDKSLIGLRDKALLELLYSTGLKVGKIVTIKKNQIDKIKKQIVFSPKNYIDIKPIAWHHLEKYLLKRKDESLWLFINFDRCQKSLGRNLSVRSVERIIDKYAKKLRPILRINPQILRNTLAFNLKHQGAQGQQIKQALHFETNIAANKYLQRL